jgi:hypothetical protein
MGCNKNMNKYGMKVFDSSPVIEELEQGDELKGKGPWSDFFPLKSKIRCIKKEEVQLTMYEDLRNWCLSLSTEINDHQLPHTQIIHVKNTELMINKGSIQYVPLSHTLQKQPTTELLQRNFFRNPKDHKIYEMKKAFIGAKKNQMIILDRWLWKSFDINASDEPVIIIIYTFELE